MKGLRCRNMVVSESAEAEVKKLGGGETQIESWQSN